MTTVASGHLLSRVARIATTPVAVVVAVVLVAACTLAYLLTMLDRVLIFREGLAARAIVISDEEARALDDHELPRYTILVPAYNEPEVVGDLIGSMAALEYPRDKLQVLLLLEADDEAAKTAAKPGLMAKLKSIFGKTGARK